MTAEVRIFTPGVKEYDPDTDTWTSTDTTHYTGKARVQPVRSARETNNTGDGTFVQRVRFQIPISADVDLRPDQQVRVTAAPLNPDLLDQQFVIVEVTDSSNPFERTFECTSNIETVLP